MEAYTFHKPIPSQSVNTSAVDARWGWGLVLLVCCGWAASFATGFVWSMNVLMVLGLGLGLLGVKWPVPGLFGIGIVCTLDAVARELLLTGGLLRYNTFNYLLLAVMLLNIPFLLRLNDLHTRLFELFALLLVLQIAVSPDRSLGVDYVLGICTFLGLVVYFARVGANPVAWYWLGVLCGATATLGGFVYYLQRSDTPYVNPNNWSYFPLAALFAICLAMPFATGRYRPQLPLVVMAVVNLAWVFLSGSRGGMLIASASVLFVLLTMRGVSNRLVMVCVALLVALVISTQFTNLQDTAIQRVTELLNTSDTLRDRTSGRSDLVLGGWYMFLDHPLGVGTGGYEPTYATLGLREGMEGFGSGQNKPAHAGWIKILAENGVPGMALFVGFVGSFTLVGVLKRRHVLLGGLVSIVFSLALLSSELHWTKSTWFLAAGALVLLHREQIAQHLAGADARQPIHNIVYSREQSNE